VGENLVVRSKRKFGLLHIAFQFIRFLSMIYTLIVEKWKDSLHIAVQFNSVQIRSAPPFQMQIAYPAVERDFCCTSLDDVSFLLQSPLI
jgi:hypothetical protein